MPKIYQIFLPLNSLSKGDVFLSLTLGLSISILLSLGPELQRVAFAFVEPNSTDLYSSAYGEGIVEFPSFWEMWLFHNQPWFLLIGLVTGAVGLFVRTASKAIPAMALSLFVLLSAYDAIIVSFFSELSFENFHQSLIANAFGSIVLSGFQYIIFIFLRDSARRLSLVGNTRRLIIIISMISINVLTSYLIIIIFKFVFNPLPAQTELVLPRTATGWYWPTETEGDDTAAWGFLPSNPIAADLSFDGLGMELDWTSPVDSRAHDLEIRLFADCLNEKPTDLPKGKPYLRRTGVRTMKVAPSQDEGTVLLRILGEQERAISFEPESVGKFWLEFDSDSKTSKIVHLVSDGDELGISTDGAAQFLVSLPLITVSGEDAKRGPRLISFSIDGETISEEFSPSSLREEDVLEWGGERFARADLLTCRSIQPGDRLVSAIGVSVLIELTPVVGDGLVLKSSNQETTISNASGWFHVESVDNKLFNSEFLGKTRMFAMRGSDAKIAINGVEEELRSHDSVWVSGEMDAYFTDQGQVALKGTGDKIFVDDKRRSPTAWENLSEGWALTIFSLFLGFIFFAGKPMLAGLQRSLSQNLEF